MLAILDYEAGNQTSVFRALSSMGLEARISSDPDLLRAADGVIFPGVGAAGQAMGHLTATGLDQLLRDLVKAGRPLLGICLGCQILLDRSEESDTKTLGLVPGVARRFKPEWTDGGEAIRIPHMGWNTFSLNPAAPADATFILNGVDPDAQFYFVHGYYPDPSPELVIATTTYGTEFPSVYGRAGLWAAQFHPEKSGRAGLKLLSNFADYCTGGRV